MNRSQIMRTTVGLVISVVSFVCAANIWERVPFSLGAGISPITRRISIDAAGNLYLTHVKAGFFKLAYPYTGTATCLNGTGLNYDSTYKSYHAWSIFQQPQTNNLIACQPAFGKNNALYFRSNDGGAHWVKMTGYGTGTNPGFPTCGDLGFLPNGVILFGSYSMPHPSSGVSYSNDSGKTCTLLPGNNSGSVLTFGYNKVTGDCWAGGADTDYANLCMVQVSHDMGKTWNNVHAPGDVYQHHDFTDMSRVVFDSLGNVIFKSQSFVWRSKDTGVTWQILCDAGGSTDGGNLCDLIIDPYGWLFTSDPAWYHHRPIVMSKTNGDSGTWVPFFSGLPSDTMRINSIVYNPIDGRLYCSARDTNALFRTINPVHPPTSVHFMNDMAPNSTFGNAFMCGSNITYSVTEKGHVALNIYSADGSLVKQLVNREMNTGTYNIGWNRTNSFGNEISSGVYFVMLQNQKNRTIKALPITR